MRLMATVFSFDTEYKVRAGSVYEGIITICRVCLAMHATCACGGG